MSEWPLDMPPSEYLNRYPEGDHAEKAREITGLSWHPMVVDWWHDVWTSPMAGEYLEADKHGLYLLAELHQEFWEAESQTQKRQMAAEIRLQAVRFGLSPIDRRRLQWEVARGEEAKARTKVRRQKDESGKDPRDVLKMA